MYEKAAAKKNEAATPADASATPGKDTSATADAAAADAEVPVDKDGAPNLSEEEKKKQAAELREVMRVAHSLERAEEEDMMKRALEESTNQ